MCAFSGVLQTGLVAFVAFQLAFWHQWLLGGRAGRQGLKWDTQFCDVLITQSALRAAPEQQLVFRLLAAQPMIGLDLDVSCWPL